MAELTLVTGPMFAGKTSHIIGNLNRYPNVFKPSIDTRYSIGSIMTHTGQSIPATNISNPRYIGEMMKDGLLPEGGLSFDEIQFFDSSIVTVIGDALNMGRDVLACGLDLDWQGRPFPVTAHLLAMADSVLKIKAICQVCRGPASKTFKKIADDLVVDLGASDKYEARCCNHWRYFN